MLKKKHAIALICLLLVIFVCSNIDYKGSKSDDFNITIIEEHKEEITDSTLHEEKINIFSLENVPVYSDSPFIDINNNIPFFNEADMTTEEFEYYSEMDYLDRCGVAFANISVDTMPTEERGDIGSVRPSGWHTVKYNGLIEGNYLYNRCHLIAYQLAGENANEKNLITGTRYLNVQGMLIFEDMVAEYVSNTQNHVLYRVTPIYEGENLLASGVLMEGYSVEDEGAGICFCVYVYNVQPGIIIDYANGNSRLDDLYENEIATITSADYSYVLNKNTYRFHYPECQSVNDMKEKNKVFSNESRDDIIGAGYKPCGRCEP